MTEEYRLKRLTTKFNYYAQRHREDIHHETVLAITERDYVYAQISFPSGGSIQLYYPREDIETMRISIQTILAELKAPRNANGDEYHVQEGPRPRDPSIG